MTTPTSNMSLAKGVDGDNSRAYLTTSLAAALDAIDIHDHTTNSKGLAVGRLSSTITVLGGGTLTLPTTTDTLVGRATADTLTNKTLTLPTIGDFTNAQHNHQGVAGGSLITFTTISGYPGGTGTGLNVYQTNPQIINLRSLGPTAYGVNGLDLTNYEFNYGTGTVSLPTPSATYNGAARKFKAWGGTLTVNVSGGGSLLAAPGGTALVASYVLANGDSGTAWCDGTQWWVL